VKRIVFLAAIVAACSSGGTTTSSASGANSTAPGAPSARGAVEAFLGAVRAQDLQAMANIWGTAKGPAKDVVDRAQLEKRELIMQCYLGHDKFEVLNEAPGKEGERVFTVSLTKGGNTKQTTFHAVEGPSDRWYVLSADLEPMQSFCSGTPTH